MDQVAFVVNIGVAFLMGSAIGIERQLRQHPAGLRTNALVCVGAALFVSLSRLMDHESSPTRIAAQVVSGIGFLGGGVILREGLSVRGMTTAATLWCSAAVGTLAGAGFAVHGAVGTGIILAMNFGLRPVSRRIDARVRRAIDVETRYRMTIVCPDEHESVIRGILARHINNHPTMVIQGISTQGAGPVGKTAVIVEAQSAIRNDRAMEELVSRINIEPGVVSVQWERVPASDG